MNDTKCRACGSGIKLNTNYCSACGRDLDDGSEHSQQKKGFVCDLLLIIGFIAIFVVIFYFTGRKGDSVLENSHSSDLISQTGESGNIDELIYNLPDNYNELIKLGNDFMDNHRFRIAAECYRRALTIDSTNPNVICDLGACLHAMSDFKSAAEMFKKAITIDSGHAIAHLNLGIVYRSMKNHEKAKLIWEKLITLYPNKAIADTAGRYIERLDN